MQPLQLMITQAGLDALVNAQSGGTDAIRVVEVGLTETPFTMAPTIDELPGEFRRLDTVSGLSASETIIHMTAIDAADVAYDLRGFGLYLADGTLFAVYAQPDPLFRKVGATTFLFVQDIAFGAPVAGSISFGDALFVNPPATETVKGVAEIATPAEAAAGTDHQRIITPLTLAQRLALLYAAIANLASETDGDLIALSNGFDAALAALTARTITGGGLVSGGGNLSANRTLTVPAASGTETAAGTAADRAVTPLGLVQALGLLGAWESAVPLFRVPGTPVIVQMGEHRGTYTTEQAVTITLPFSFPTACLYAGPVPYISVASNVRDLMVQMLARNPGSFSVYLQASDDNDNRVDGFDWIAIGY